MNKLSERGQIAMVFVFIVAVVAVALILMMAGNQRGMKSGADAIGNAVGDAIDNMTDQDWRNIDWQVQNGSVVTFWVNSQRIYPNKHSIESHGADAWAATNCYNDHGAFMVMANKAGDFYLPCREEDGKVRLTVWKRSGNQLHMESAYTPKDGVWSRIADWLRNTHGASKTSLPPDATLVIDGQIP